MIVIGFIIYMVAIALLRGASLDVFWDWFIAGPSAPFHGSAPDISTIQALGISLIVTFLTYQVHDTDDEQRSGSNTLAKLVGQTIAFYGGVWVCALIYHGLM